MGMYTELYLTCEFKKELPEDVTAVLQHLFSDGDKLETTPDSGSPDANPLAMVTISGWMEKCSKENHFPVRPKPD